jgi:hypothetical protein
MSTRRYQTEQLEQTDKEILLARIESSLPCKLSPRRNTLLRTLTVRALEDLAQQFESSPLDEKTAFALMGREITDEAPRRPEMVQHNDANDCATVDF